MKLTIADVIHLLEFVTNDQADAILHNQQFLLTNPLIDEQRFKDICIYLDTLTRQLGEKGKLTKSADIKEQEFDEVFEEISKILTNSFGTWFALVKGFFTSESANDVRPVFQNGIDKLTRKVLETKDDWKKKVIEWNDVGCTLSGEEKLRQHDQALDKCKELLSLHVITFNSEFSAGIQPILSSIGAENIEFSPRQLPKHTSTLDLIEKLAKKEREANRTNLNKGVVAIGKGVGYLVSLPVLMVYGIGKGAYAGGKSFYHSWVNKGIHNCQDLLAAYRIYEKIKPIFKTEDDKEILKILHNRNFTKQQQEINGYLIAQANIILSDTPPHEFMKILNVKLLGLEQRIWELAVQPALNWDSQHRQALHHLIGLLLYIEQTNRELSISTLHASDTYQTKDAWWKIFSVVGVLAPSLLLKFGALNYLSHWFGSSSSISAFIGKSIMKAIGSVGSNGDYDSIKDNEISISTNSANNSEILTGVLVTSGMAVETLSMVVATRIAYMNYSSATDAYKKMIEEAEKTATHVVDRCSRLIGDRLNHIDRALPFLNTEKIENLRTKLFSPPVSLQDQRILEIKELLTHNHIAIQGKVVEGEKTVDDTNKDVTLYTYQGIVFRSDSRTIQKVNVAGGLKGRKDLNEAKNKMEAQGILTKEGVGATGQSGSSCARYIDGAYHYGEYAEGKNRMYIIDTSKLDQGHYAYDMSSIVTRNYPNNNDETGFEVNCTEIPMKAILGYIEYSTGLNYFPPRYTANPYI